MKFVENAVSEASCSFCEKSFRDVGPLVEGPRKNYICHECVDLCQQIIEMETVRRTMPAQQATSVIKGSSVSEVLCRVVGSRADGSRVVLDELPIEKALDVKTRLGIAKVFQNVAIEPILSGSPAVPRAR